MDLFNDLNGVKIGKDTHDWHVGANSPIVQEVLVPNLNWKPYKGEHEIQFYNDGKNTYETSFCVTYSAFKGIICLFNCYIDKGKLSQDNLNWLKDPVVNGKHYPSYFKNGKLNFSERFNATLGGSDANGAYQFKIANSIYNYGLIPQTMFELANNFNDSIDPKFITAEMYALGKEFKKRFSINYQWVDNVKDQLPYSPVQLIAKFANYVKEDDILAPVGSPNHAMCDVFATDVYNEIEDTYWQTYKRYNPNFTFSYLAYKLTINNNNNDMDIAKWLKDNDKKWVQNSNSGQFGRVLQNKLMVVSSTDRGTLMLLDDKMRTEPSIKITNEEWNQIPKQSF